MHVCLRFGCERALHVAEAEDERQLSAQQRGHSEKGLLSQIASALNCRRTCFEPLITCMPFSGRPAALCLALYLGHRRLQSVLLQAQIVRTVTKEAA